MIGSIPSAWKAFTISAVEFVFFLCRDRDKTCGNEGVDILRLIVIQNYVRRSNEKYFLKHGHKSYGYSCIVFEAFNLFLV